MMQPSNLFQAIALAALILYSSQVTRSAETQPVTTVTSKVPFFRFATTLEAQEAQLKSNELMLRFAASRQQLAADPYRPAYHFVNPESTLNDPNGLCFWMGRWHLFYQAYPPEDRRQHWGHAVSDDLVHWRDLPYAIYPNPETKCYSGAILVEPQRAIAMYHGVGLGNMVAVSSDPLLLNWEKLGHGAVIPTPPAKTKAPYMIYDPCVWKKDGQYYSLSGRIMPAGPPGKTVPAEYLFRSQDLVNWEYVHQFLENDRFSSVGDDGACPNFWPIGDRHILLYFSHHSGGQYLLGDYDQAKDKFLATSHGNFNFGAVFPGGVHAPSATPDGKGGVIAIFNINSARPTPGWNQIMSLPRRLTLEGKDGLRIEPAGDLPSLRYDHHHQGPLTLKANKETVLPAVQGNSLEIDFEVAPTPAPMLALDVLRSPGREEFTRISFYRNRGATYERSPSGDKAMSLVTIDNSCSSILPDTSPRPPESAPVLLAPDEPLRVRVFVDKSVVEVFVNERQCIAMRAYPGRPDSLGVSFRSQGKNVTLKSLDAWQIKSVY